MEFVGIVLAVLSAVVVLGHARYRGLSIPSMLLWTAGAFLLMIIIVPIYFLIHGPDPKEDNGRS